MGEYISITQAANILKISRQAVFARIQAGSLRADKVGRQWIIKESELKKQRNYEQI